MNKIVVLNQKTYLDKDDVLEYIENIKDKIRRDLEVIVCPNYIYIPYFSGKYDFKLGSQDLSFKEVTGEVSAKSLKSFGVTYALIGHSERIEMFNETSMIINNKIKEALKYSIIPIVLVGETKEEHQRKHTGEVIIKQLKSYLKNVDVKEDLIIAYEPRYLIGQEEILDIKELTNVISMIKDIFITTYNINIKVIYGGGITSKNIEELNKISLLDGILLGKSSSSFKETLEILDLVE